MKRKRLWRIRLLRFVLWVVGLATLAGMALFIVYTVAQGLAAYSGVDLVGQTSVIMGTLGLLPYIINTLLVLSPCLLLAVPLGIGIALCIYLLPPGRLRNAGMFLMHTWAFTPPIVFAMVGIAIFSTIMAFGIGLLTGTLSIIIMVIPKVCYDMLDAIGSIPAARIQQAVAMGPSRFALMRWMVYSELIPDIVLISIKVMVFVLGEATLLVSTAGAGGMVASSLGASYTQSGGTLSVALYVYAAQLGDVQAAFFIALILMGVLLVLEWAASGYAKRRKGRRLSVLH